MRTRDGARAWADADLPFSMAPGGPTRGPGRLKGSGWAEAPPGSRRAMLGCQSCKEQRRALGAVSWGLPCAAFGALVYHPELLSPAPLRFGEGKGAPSSVVKVLHAHKTSERSVFEVWGGTGVGKCCTPTRHRRGACLRCGVGKCCTTSECAPLAGTLDDRAPVLRAAEEDGERECVCVRVCV